MQHELSLTGKSNATLDDIKEYINRRCQLQIATPTHQVSLVNEVSTNSNANAETRNSRPQQDNREKPRGKFNGYCDYCGIWGHKKAECRKKIRDEKYIDQHPNSDRQRRDDRRDDSRDNRNNNRDDSRDRRRDDSNDKPKYNQKLVCQICGYTGHSAKKCYQRTKGASICIQKRAIR